VRDNAAARWGASLEGVIFVLRGAEFDVNGVDSVWKKRPLSARAPTSCAVRPPRSSVILPSSGGLRPPGCGNSEPNGSASREMGSLTTSAGAVGVASMGSLTTRCGLVIVVRAPVSRLRRLRSSGSPPTGLSDGVPALRPTRSRQLRARVPRQRGGDRAPSFHEDIKRRIAHIGASYGLEVVPTQQAGRAAARFTGAPTSDSGATPKAPERVHLGRGRGVRRSCRGPLPKFRRALANSVAPSPIPSRPRQVRGTLANTGAPSPSPRHPRKFRRALAKSAAPSQIPGGPSKGRRRPREVRGTLANFAAPSPSPPRPRKFRAALRRDAGALANSRAPSPILARPRQFREDIKRQIVRIGAIYGLGVVPGRSQEQPRG
jgi:hypothetical protein